MKMMIDNSNSNNDSRKSSSYQLIFMLVSLLLFLPIAQADHLLQHDSLPSDVHCLVCHSAMDIDGACLNPSIQHNLNTI
jgi:predicted nucleic acid-binding Zn ribbon protein